MNNTGNLFKRIDWITTLVPFISVIALGLLFLFVPDGSKIILEQIRGFLSDDLGLYYAVLGVGVFGLTIWLSFSKKYGRVYP